MTTPPASPGAADARRPGGLLDAWQAALAAEHRAVFGYGTLGPRLGPASAVRARDDERSHRDERDGLLATVTAAGGQPVPSRADYALPSALTSTLATQRLALELEVECARAWRFVLAVAASPPSPAVPASTATPIPSATPSATATAPTTAPGTAATAAIRADALRAMTAAAIRAMRWRQRIMPTTPTEPFPGI